MGRHILTSHLEIKFAKNGNFWDITYEGVGTSHPDIVGTSHKKVFGTSHPKGMVVGHHIRK